MLSMVAWKLKSDDEELDYPARERYSGNQEN